MSISPILAGMDQKVPNGVNHGSHLLTDPIKKLSTNGDIPNGHGGPCLNGFKNGSSFAHHLRKMSHKYGVADGAATLDHKLNQLRSCIMARPKEELMKIASYQSDQIQGYNFDRAPPNGQGVGCKKLIAERKEELRLLMTKLDTLNAELHRMRQRKSSGLSLDSGPKTRDCERIERLKEIYKDKSALCVEQDAKISHHQRFLYDLQHDLSSIIKQLEVTSRQLYQHDESSMLVAQAPPPTSMPLPKSTSARSPTLVTPCSKLEYADIIRCSPQKTSTCLPPPCPYYTTSLVGASISNRITPSTLPLGSAIPWHPPKAAFCSSSKLLDEPPQHIYARIGLVGSSSLKTSNNETPDERNPNFRPGHATIPRPSISVPSSNVPSCLDKFDCGLEENGNFHAALTGVKLEKFHFNPHSLKSLRRRHSYAEPIQGPTPGLEPTHLADYHLDAPNSGNDSMPNKDAIPEISRRNGYDSDYAYPNYHDSLNNSDSSKLDNVTVSTSPYSYPSSHLRPAPPPKDQTEPSLNVPMENGTGRDHVLPSSSEVECNAGSGSSGEESWQTVTTTTIPSLYNSGPASCASYPRADSNPVHYDSDEEGDFNTAVVTDQGNSLSPPPSSAREFYNDMESFEGNDNDKSLDGVCQLSPRPSTYGQNAVEQYWEENPLTSSDLKSCLKKRASDANGDKTRRVQFDPLALLLDAALEGELDLVIQSANKAADPSASNDEGITALHNAICAGHYDILKFLVDFGCDINAQDSDGWTPLHCAASCNNFDMIKYLVENGASVFATTVSDNETALEKCEEDEYDYHRCASYLYRIQENTGVANEGRVFALYDFQAKELDELTFSLGETLVIRDRDRDENWWAASNLAGQSGFVPKNYIGLYKRILWKPTKDQ